MRDLTLALLPCCLLVALSAPSADGQPSGMVLIPAGPFQMGDTFNEGGYYERPVHTVYLSPYYIGTFEVTSQEYAEGLNWALAQGNLITVTDGVVYKYSGWPDYPYCDTTTSNAYAYITWNGSTFGAVAGREHHPMLEVSWCGAVAYANWRSAMEGKPLCYDLSNWSCDFGADGYRLPTEPEWEKAARGGSAGHRFPWSDSDTIQHARANYWSQAASYTYDTSPTPECHPVWWSMGVNGTNAVGFFTGALQYKADWGWPRAATMYQTASGASGYGLHDMAGNVAELCNDWFSDVYYGASPSANPTGPVSGAYRVRRGGHWQATAGSCRCAFRTCNSPSTCAGGIGFRLARPARIPGDINRDEHVDAADLLVLAASFGKCEGNSGYDSRCNLNGDACVDISDLLILAGNWGA